MMGLLLLVAFAAIIILPNLSSCSAKVGGTEHLDKESTEYVQVAACTSADKRGLRVQLELRHEGFQEYGPSFKSLLMYARLESDERLHVHLTTNESKGSRWEVPHTLLPRPPLPQEICDLQPGMPFDSFELSNTALLAFRYTREPFGFAVQRRSTGEVLFNSTPPGSGPSFSPLVFKDQYLEISTSLPSSTSLYGLGESTRPAGLKLKPNETYTLWASDISASSRNIPLYGVHPFYTDLRESGSAHGVLFLNSNGMDISLAPEALTMRAIGGVFDLYFFAGPHPLKVVQQYTDLVGKPAPVPYWALGFHQSRWGYKSVSELRQVAANYSAAGIPLDALWSDIDYMDHYKDFTTDLANYAKEDVQAFVAGLHKNGQHYVVIVDPGIKVEAGYPAYERGLQADVFVRYPDGTPVLGQVWPGPVHYPDFVMHGPNVDYWQEELAKFHQVVPYDGLWIDMNEASNFCSAVHCALPPPDKPRPGAITDCFLDCSDDNATRWDLPPYKLNGLGDHRSLGTKTIPMSAFHHNGVRAYDAHNLYGFAEGRATHIALRNIVQKRPFVLSRSTFSGAGAWAAHWSGDNTATWEDLRFSIVSILNMGLFGVPHVGADICGFAGTTTEELCLRWIQAGALYPFSRDHSDIRAAPQELYRWPSVTTAARASLGLRYRLLPYLYTLTFHAHQNGAPIARPLFMEFPTDARARGTDEQFLLGPGVLVSPVLSPGATIVEAYFPRGTWYSLVDASRVVSGKGQTEVLPAPWDSPPPVHIRGGHIVPMQQGGLTAAAARKTPFSIVVALPDASVLGDASMGESCFKMAGGKILLVEGAHMETGTSGGVQPKFLCAAGELFLDSGDDLEMKVAAPSSTYVSFQAGAASDTDSGHVSSSVTFGDFAQKEGYVLDEIVVLGVNSRPKILLLNGDPVGKDVSVSFKADQKKLVISHLGLALYQPFHLRWAASAVT